ncbi:MAG: hypothetical protein KME54_17675 [Tolypothrix brevis GSE-NOS-MK-07-07A]|nr:hypothetical protein [Tolypothrix brevis GSE-NOS-MK-07-07A]
MGSAPIDIFAKDRTVANLSLIIEEGDFSKGTSDSGTIAVVTNSSGVRVLAFFDLSQLPCCASAFRRFHLGLHNRDRIAPGVMPTKECSGRKCAEYSVDCLILPGQRDRAAPKVRVSRGLRAPRRVRNYKSRRFQARPDSGVWGFLSS